MSEQNGGPNEANEAGSTPGAGSKPNMGPDAPLAGHHGAEPPIDAEAGETSAIHGDHPVDPPVPAGESVEPPVERVEELVTGSEPSEAAAESDAKAEEEEELAAWEPIPERVAEKPRKNSPMMVAAGAAVIGLAGYYGLSQFVRRPNRPNRSPLRLLLSCRPNTPKSGLTLRRPQNPSLPRPTRPSTRLNLPRLPNQ